MISAKMTINYISPGGRECTRSPECKEMQTGWEKKWLLAVDVDGGRYFSEHKEPLGRGLAEDPEFNEHIKKALAKSIGNMIGDMINNQI